MSKSKTSTRKEGSLLPSHLPTVLITTQLTIQPTSDPLLSLINTHTRLCPLLGPTPGKPNKLMGTSPANLRELTPQETCPTQRNNWLNSSKPSSLQEEPEVLLDYKDNSKLLMMIALMILTHMNSRKLSRTSELELVTETLKGSSTSLTEIDQERLTTMNSWEVSEYVSYLITILGRNEWFQKRSSRESLQNHG